MCKLWEKDFKHFKTCGAYENNPLNIHWNEIFGNDVDKQVTIAEEIKRRQYKKKGWPASLPGSHAPELFC